MAYPVEGFLVSCPPEETQVYVRRRGRMTAGQARALQALREQYCVPLHRSGSAQLAVHSANAAPMGLEIGFGMGQALLHWATERPTWRLYGVEVYQPGIGALLLGLEREGLPNVRVFEAPAEDVLEHGFGSASLDEVRIFFPDPWPKKRHHKRRIIQPEFAALLADRLRPGGRLWLATDWAPYAVWMLDVLEAEPALVNETGPGAFASRARDDRVETRFEARGKRLGHEVWDLLYQRKR